MSLTEWQNKSGSPQHHKENILRALIDIIGVWLVVDAGSLNGVIIMSDLLGHLTTINVTTTAHF